MYDFVASDHGFSLTSGRLTWLVGKLGNEYLHGYYRQQLLIPSGYSLEKVSSFVLVWWCLLIPELFFLKKLFLTFVSNTEILKIERIEKYSTVESVLSYDHKNYILKQRK